MKFRNFKNREQSTYKLMIFLFICFLSMSFLIFACDDDDDDNNNNDDNDNGLPILDASHPGWKTTDCGECHNLPVENHTTSNITECAACHGGNGACNPNGSGSNKQDHVNTDNCILCHESMHGFVTSGACRRCHFAEEGVVDCN